MLAIAPLIEEFQWFDSDRKIRGGVFLRRQHERSLALGQVPLENAWSGEVFLAVQAAVAFLFVEEVVIPMGLVTITAVRDHAHPRHPRGHTRQARVGLP